MYAPRTVMCERAQWRFGRHIYIYTHTRMFIHIYVCMYVYTHIHILEYTNIPSHIRTDMYVHICACMCAYIITLKHTKEQLEAFSRANTYIYTHTYISQEGKPKAGASLTSTHKCTRTYTTCTQILIHTRTHTPQEDKHAAGGIPTRTLHTKPAPKSRLLNHPPV